MIIHQGIDNLQFKNTIVTIGIFDGVHLAHQKLLLYLRETAKKNGKESALITFWPHPRTVLHPTPEPIKFLSTQEEKFMLIGNQGIDHLVILPFTKEFSEVTATEFVNDILVDKIDVQELVLGYDHHFGKNREGNIAFLKANTDKFSFKITEIAKQVIHDVPVNSSNIRKMLATGDARGASELLGRHYSFSGLVVKGNQLGRTIGFPTANLHIENESKLIPANGVYAVKVRGEKSEVRNGMLNIGVRPTVDGKQLTIEVNIFDFDEEIYGSTLTIELIVKLRDEQKFEGIEGLTKQLAQDKLHSIQVLR